MYYIYSIDNCNVSGVKVVIIGPKFVYVIISSCSCYPWRFHWICSVQIHTYTCESIFRTMPALSADLTNVCLPIPELPANQYTSSPVPDALNNQSGLSGNKSWRKDIIIPIHNQYSYQAQVVHINQNHDSKTRPAFCTKTKCNKNKFA